jgi:hypothetical protein
MSDLHQYELHYYWTMDSADGAITRLVWAYSVSEACFQLDLELKPRNNPYYKIVEAGPVKKALNFPPNTRFHVCPECQDVVPCFNTECYWHGRSDSPEPCRTCMGKKPHRHFCSLCVAEIDCGWIEKNTWCSSFDSNSVPCTKHTTTELQAFFQKQYEAERPLK